MNTQYQPPKVFNIQYHYCHFWKKYWILYWILYSMVMNAWNIQYLKVWLNITFARFDWHNQLIRNLGGNLARAWSARSRTCWGIIDSGSSISSSKMSSSHAESVSLPFKTSSPLWNKDIINLISNSEKRLHYISIAAKNC